MTTVGDIAALALTETRGRGMGLRLFTSAAPSMFDPDSRRLDPGLVFGGASRVPPLPPTIDESWLSPLTQMSDDATGAEAVVHRTRQPGLLVKKYLDPHAVHRPALDAAVRWRRGLPATERRIVDAHTSWPLAVVADHAGTATGVAMIEAPASFSYVRRTRGIGLLELQLLAEPRYARVLGYQLPDTSQRVRLVRNMAELTALFERHQVVHGDFSYRNLLYSADNSGVFILDCDGAQIGGAAPFAPRLGTPEWIDPDRPAAGPDLESQRWQLALAMARIVGRCRQRPPDHRWILRLPSDLGAASRALRAMVIAGLGPRGGRPAADDWHRHLIGLT